MVMHAYVCVGLVSFGLRRWACKGHKPFHNPYNLDLHLQVAFFLFSKRDPNPRSLRFGVGDQRRLFSFLMDIVWLSHKGVNTSSSSV